MKKILSLILLCLLVGCNHIGAKEDRQTAVERHYMEFDIIYAVDEFHHIGIKGSKMYFLKQNNLTNFKITDIELLRVVYEREGLPNE